MDRLIEARRDWIWGLLVPWLVLAFANAPIWIWQDGRYGIVKALFFALAFAVIQRIKNNLFDVAVFSLVMTVLQVFSRQVVNYHALVFEVSLNQAFPFALQVGLTVVAGGLFAWLFQLAATSGPSYPLLASAYVTFYLLEFIGHALVVQIARSYPVSMGKLVYYIGLSALPLAVGWVLRGAGSFLGGRFETRVGRRSWSGAFENTRYVLMSCLALYLVEVVWFGFVFFAIGKLGVATHFQMALGCPPQPELPDYLLLSLAATVGLDTGCLASASLLARAVDYLAIVVTLLLALVIVQAIALARGAARAQDSLDHGRS